MRTYGRDPVTKQWRVVQTDPTTGDDSNVYLTTLAQVFKLNLNESPFYANYGIPAAQSVATQVAPDFYVAFIQQQFSQYFASLIVYRKSFTDSKGRDVPTYNVSVVTKYGAKLSGTIAT